MRPSRRWRAGPARRRQRRQRYCPPRRGARPPRPCAASRPPRGWRTRAPSTRAPPTATPRRACWRGPTRARRPAARTGRSATTSRNSRRRGESYRASRSAGRSRRIPRPLAVCSRRGPRARGCGTPTRASARRRIGSRGAPASGMPGACRGRTRSRTRRRRPQPLLPAAVARGRSAAWRTRPAPAADESRCRPPLPAGLRLINIDNISSPGCLNYRSNAGHGGSRAAIVAYRGHDVQSPVFGGCARRNT